MQYNQSAGQLGVAPSYTVERVCAGLPALLALLADTIKVQP